MTTEELPLLERIGVRYFRRLSTEIGPVDAGDGVHYLNPDERRGLRRVERGAIVRACIAGGLSTVVSAVAELYARAVLGAAADSSNPKDVFRFWSIVGGATAVASVVEISYLYWDGLRSVHRLAHVAGLDLFPEGRERTAVAQAMARAALELPNPTAAVLGVDPRREASRLGLVFASLVYKLKISVSNFLIKAFVRRVLGRAVVRSWLPFVAVPITAAWNGIVCWLVVREARIRAMGPSAVTEMVGAVMTAHGKPLSPSGRITVLRAVASSIVRTRDLHPNLVALLEAVRERVGEAPREAIDDTDHFLECLEKLDPDEQTLALETLSVAAVIDGRITRAERQLVAEARRRCGRSPTSAAAERLRRAFVAGDALDLALLRSTAL